MLDWITEHRYSAFDTIWLIWFGLAIHDRHYFAAVVAIVVGAVLSATLEHWNKQRKRQP